MGNRVVYVTVKCKLSCTWMAALPNYKRDAGAGVSCINTSNARSDV